MSLAQRFERRLESVVGSAFARVFKGQVEPVEIGNALQREADDKRAVMGNDRVFVPNRYRVSLGPSDYDRLAPWEAQLCTSLAELVQEHLDDNRWTTVGDIEVYLHRDESLHTGVFGVASRMEAEAPPRRRPYDSLSLPAVAGVAPGQYEHPFGDDGERGSMVPGFDDSGAGPQSAGPQSAGPQSAGPQSDGRQGDGEHSYGDQVPAGYTAPPGYEQYPPQQYPPAGYDQFAGAQQWGPAAGAPQGQPGYAAGARYAAPAGPPPYAELPRRPRVRATLFVEGTDRRLDLRRGSNVIGRSHDADLQLFDQGVSRRHLDVQFDGDYAVAYDLGSTNGTSVNGHHIGSTPLEHGDTLRVGHTRLLYHQETG